MACMTTAPGGTIVILTGSCRLIRLYPIPTTHKTGTATHIQGTTQLNIKIQQGIFQSLSTPNKLSEMQLNFLQALDTRLLEIRQ